MKNDEIKRANRKALPKFLLFAVVCLIAGGVIGYFSGYGSAKGETGKLVEIMKNAGAFFGMNIAPWLMVATAIITPAVCVPIYIKAKKLLGKWDGEDESIADDIDRKLSVVILITSVTLILSYFLIAASYSGGVAIFDDPKRTVVFFIGVAAFFAILIEGIIIQQKCVDTVKRTNPEKKASVYDMRFQKKWLDDCDEAEKIIVGKCSYKAYNTTNIACMILSALLAVSALVFEIGFLPSLTVCLIWIVNTAAYFKESMKYSQTGNKIS